MYNTRALLSAMALVEQVSIILGTTSYLWGGCALDVYQGHILRAHSDLDYLTEDLYTHFSRFVEQFEQRGCVTKKLRNGDLSVRGWGLPIHLGNIGVEEQVTWTHNGTQASLRFPLRWLDSQPIRFCGVDVHVVQPELEYVLKSQPALLNTQWQPRQQDIDAQNWLRMELERRGVDVAALNKFVESCAGMS